MNKANGLQLQLLNNPSSVLEMNEERINRRMKNNAVGQRFLFGPSLSPSFSVRLESKEIDVYEGVS